MAYPHKDEMVWLAGRWWWFLGAQNGGSSCSSPTTAPSRPLCSWKRSRLSEVLRSAATRVLNTRTSLAQSIRKMGRSGRGCLKFKSALKGVSFARPQAGC